MIEKLDPRNKLNDLTGKEWIISTKSVWRFDDYDLDKNLPENMRHFQKLILFFSKKNDLILNPTKNQMIIKIGLKEGRRVALESNDLADFILHEDFPSYNILDFISKKDIKFHLERYKKFYEVLKNKKYLCVITRIFLPNTSELVLYHHYLSSISAEVGFKLKGLIVWVPKIEKGQNYLMNDIILIFRKEADSAKNIDFNFKNYDSREFLSKIRFFKTYMLSIPPPRDDLKSQHPATFAESDIKNLVLHFTALSEHPRVLDPFSGVGSTILACLESKIEGWGIELTKKWISITKKRFNKINQPIRINGKLHKPKQIELNSYSKDSQHQPIIQNLLFGDAREKLDEIDDEFFDFIVTSPPYWGILTKKIDHKTRKERVDKGLDLKYSVEGEDETFKQDLGNLENYGEFLNQLKEIFKKCFNKLKKGKYFAVIVSDFRDGSYFFLYHCDIAFILKEIGFKLTGFTILHQDNKNLYPYGYPFAFVSNIHHQNIIIVKKE
ncbi:MAG: site-specific DNA-methyltransferase [Candidatus Lokiarchaeota archaeon]|nr:site-specific DNA-methyltransferase [Candidatus Lokiarchaeota archaeon]